MNAGRSAIRGEGAWAFAACAGAVALAAGLFYDFWTPRVFLGAYDIYTQEYLRWEWGWRCVFEYVRLPLWNPYLFGGYPFVATFGFCPFYPPAWLCVALPTSLALTTRFAMSLAIGAVGFYALARALGVRPALALAAALLYESGAHVATLAYPGHLHKVEAIAWCPWAMAAAVMLARRGDLRWAVGLGAAWALQMLASHAQIFYATFWMATLYVLGALACERRWRFAARPLGGLALAGILAGGLAAAQLLPGRAMARESNRAGGLDLESAAFGALPPEEFFEAALPSFRGDSTGSLAIAAPRAGTSDAKAVLPYVGRWHASKEQSAERLVSDYAGVWAVLLALAGLALGRGRARWFFFASGVAAALISVGQATPLFAWAHRLVPGFSQFRSPATFAIGLHVSLFALAALGTEACAERVSESSRRRRVWIVGALLCAGVGGVVGWGVLRGWLSSAPAALGDPERAWLAARSILMEIAWRHVAFSFGFGALALGALVAFSSGSGRWPMWVAGAAFLAIALFDTTSHARRFLPRQSTAGIEQYLRANWIESAILSHARGAALPTTLDVSNPLSNRSMLRGVRSVNGYHPLVYADYEKLLSAAGGFDSENLARHFAQNYRAESAEKPVSEGWRVVAEQGGRRVVARIEPIALARVPRRIDALGRKWDAMSPAEWSERLKSDPAERTICEGDYAWNDPSEGLTVRAQLANPNEFHLELAGASGAEGGYVPCLLAVPAGAGWSVRIDVAGRRGAWLADWPRRANGFFLLVPLSPEPGARTVVAYRPAPQRIGIAISLLSLLLVVGFLAWDRKDAFSLISARRGA